MQSPIAAVKRKAQEWLSVNNLLKCINIIEGYPSIFCLRQKIIILSGKKIKEKEV